MCLCEKEIWLSRFSGSRYSFILSGFGKRKEAQERGKTGCVFLRRRGEGIVGKRKEALERGESLEERKSQQDSNLKFKIAQV